MLIIAGLPAVRLPVQGAAAAAALCSPPCADFVQQPGRRPGWRLAVSLTGINNSTSGADPVSGANPLCHGGVDVLFTSPCLLIIMGWQCIICSLRGGRFRTCGSCSQNSFFSFEPSEMIPSEQKRSRALACECFLHHKMSLIKLHKF